MANWIPPTAIPNKNDGDPLTAKDLKDVIASLQTFLTGVGTVSGTGSSLNGEIPIFSGSAGALVMGGTKVIFADPNAAGTTTGGIQEAIEALGSGGGEVWCYSRTTYTVTGSTAATASVWLHPNVTLHINGATIFRGASSLTTARSVINACVYGSNGTLPTSGTTLSNIAVVGPGTIDGNTANFSSNVGQGIEIKYTSDLVLDNFTVRNCQQDGIGLDQCRFVRGSGIYLDTVGQASAVTSRNGISLYNNGNDAAGFSTGFVFENIVGKNIGDEFFSFYGVSDCTVSNSQVDGCDTIIEFQNHPTVAVAGNIVCTGIAGKNCLQEAIFFSLTQGTASGFNHVIVDGFQAVGHATLHDGGAIVMVANSAQAIPMTDIQIRNFDFSNINTKDTNAKPWINVQTGTSPYKGIKICDGVLSGLASSTRTADTGLVVKGNVSNSRFNGLELRNVAGFGTNIGGISGLTATMERIQVNDLVLDTCNSAGVFVGPGAVATQTMRFITFKRPTVRDACMQAESRAFLLQTSAAGSMSKIFFIQPVIQKQNSTLMTVSFRLDATGAALFDEIYFLDPDFAGLAPTEAGTPTNIHLRPVPGRGSDIASAATITIPVDGDTFHVTGGTNISGINKNSWDKGRRAKLIFDGALTVNAATTNAKVAGAFGPTTADDSMVLTHDGTNWNEDARSVNA